MIFITHVAFAVLVCLIFRIPLDFGLVLGSTLPDIDYPYSFIGQLFSPISQWISKKFGHRGLTHSFYWSLLLGVIAYFDRKYLTLFIGYTSHILLDLFTNQGVKLIYPYNASFVIFDGPVETGSKTDKILAVVFAILCILIPLVLEYLPNLTI
ncbi:LexA-binding, inner membrane-associated putative hydrolase [Candidatus Tiddalikarchaeum anstoanum]|nr:LexA-binding, inner membrane-associated putative hydrolase [Candidatus Tiddalikarchaeum anstoanum]